MQNIPNLTKNESGERVKTKCVFLRKFCLNMLFLSVYVTKNLIKRELSLHGNVAILIKLSEMTVNIARLTNNITFYFPSLV